MLYDGDILEHDGEKFRVAFPRDETLGAPWDEYDGHGPVSDWTTRGKLPGEFVLARDSGFRRFYDFAEACRAARRDGWNAEPYDVPGETPRQRAAKAARANFEYLRRWCADEWCFVGVVVTLLDDGDPIEDESDSLWGVESDSPEYLERVARECADEIIARFRSYAV